MRNAVILDSQYPPVGERKDYKEYIDYMINQKEVDLIVCGNVDKNPIEILNDVTIVRTFKKTIIQSRLSELYLCYFIIACLFKYKVKKIYLFYFTLAPMIIIFAKIFGIKSIIDFRSVPLNGILIGRLLRTICGALSDMNVFISKDVINEMFIFQIDKKYRILPIGIDSKIIRSINTGKKREDTRTEFNIRDKFTFILVGTIHRTRKPEDVINAFLNLHKINSDIQLIIVGSGPYYNVIKSLVEKINTQDIILTGIVNYEMALSLMSISHVGITYYSKKIYNVQPALKTLEYLAIGLPVISVNTIGNRPYINNGINGFLIEDNPKDLYEAMNAICSDEALFNKMKKTVGNFDIKKYSYQMICNETLKKIFNTI